MNWQETLEAIKPLVSEHGYQEAKLFVMSRKTTVKQGIFFNREVETTFKLEPDIFNKGIVIKNNDAYLDFTIVY